MSEKKIDRSMRLTIIAAIGIVAAAVVLVCLYRFTGFLNVQPTEKKIARNLDLKDSQWLDTLMEISLPSYKKDFSLYSAFSNSNGKNTVTQVYATRAELDDVRTHYTGLLDNPHLPEKNDVGVLEISGLLKDRKVKVVNYFSEVSNLIQVEMEISGEYADVIWRKVTDAFPLQALDAPPEIAVFAAGESTEAYVMYNHDPYATDVYANIPLFSRAYVFAGTIEELEEKINALGERFTSRAVISEGIAEIRHDSWLYQVKPLENFSGVRVALIIQEIPGSS